MKHEKTFFDKWIVQKSRLCYGAKSVKWNFLMWLHDLFVDENIRKAVLETAKITNAELICDVGCGDGTYTLLLSRERRNSFVIGCELSLKSLEIAKRKIEASDDVKSKVDFVLCDAALLPFRRKSFDLTIVINVIHHLPNLLVLKDVKRVLKKSGQVLIFEVTSDNPLVELGRVVFPAIPQRSKIAFSEYELVVGSEIPKTIHYKAAILKKSVCDAGFNQIWEKRLGLFNFVFWYVPTLIPSVLRFFYRPFVISTFRVEEKLIAFTPFRRLCCNILLRLELNRS